MTRADRTIVGFTGHQTLSDKTVELVRAELVARLAELGPIAGVTSLAAGADQIFAECVLSLGGELLVVVPSHRYESSFASDEALETFRRLLAVSSESSVLDHDEPDETAFWDAGKRVVDQSEQLLAVWDGQDAAGLGGTADVVRYAIAQGRDVVVIWPPGSSRDE